jgi:hypothetical protein
MALAPIRIGRDIWWGLPFSILAKWAVPPVHHSFKHFKGNGKGNFVGLEKFSIRRVPAAQDRLELSLYHLLFFLHAPCSMLYAL